MDASIWSATLAGFREKVRGTEPVPAGVAISAVTASLALGLLMKVLEITRGRKGFAGDAGQIAALIEGARRESDRLAQLADEDIRAFQKYLESRSAERDAAAREAVRVPLEAARSVARGLKLCDETGAIGLTDLMAADLGSVVSLLRGAIEAMLLSVDANLRVLAPNDAFREGIKAELADLRRLAQKHAS